MEKLKGEIELLALHDSTVKAYLSLFHQTDIAYVDILEQLVIALQAEKKAYYERCVTLEMTRPSKVEV